MKDLQTAVARIALLVILSATAWATAAEAEKRTVCTVTVNSSDEKEVFRRHLPPGEYQFVELVERGRPDWLASACRQRIRCDILIVSGHFNGTEFFSDRLDASEYLPVQEMERASCNASCSGVFSQLKEVYLFGCNTLNPETTQSLPSEIERTLVREGYSRAEADRVAKDVDRRYVQSNRDVTRRVFMNVPLIYGFSSRAPVGPTAASLLNRSLQPSSGERLGSGSVNRKLLGSFAASSLTAAAGIRAGDIHASYRDEVCRFLDEQRSPAQKLDFIHQILNRDPAEARVFLDRIEVFLSSLSDGERQEPEAAGALDAIARDQAARDRFLHFARADQASVRARMTAVARDLGWLSPADYRGELMSMIRDLLSGASLTAADVDLVCSLNDGHSLDAELDRLEPALTRTDRTDHAAVLACLGGSEQHDRMLLALSSPNADDVRMAEVYFRHRPITDLAELRVVASSVARMNGSDAQARALDVLARQHLFDYQSLVEVTRLFPRAGSLSVQRAIAGLIIRADYRTIATPETIRMLRESRLKSSGGEDIIDILIRRLEASS